MTNDTYFDAIRRNCDAIISEVSNPYPAIFYRDGDYGYAAFLTPSGVAEYSCDSMEDFRMLCESVTDDDGEPDNFDDGYDEMGFDPYEGCYTYDC